MRYSVQVWQIHPAPLICGVDMVFLARFEGQI